MPSDFLSDAGTAITAEIITQRDFLPQIADPDEIKLVKYLYLFATPISTLQAHISYDGKDFVSLGTVTSYPQKFNLGFVKCRYIELKLTESSSNKRFILEAYLVVGDKVPERP